MRADWSKLARGRLLGLRLASGAWSYRDATAPAAEPTALAGLALHATDLAAARTAGRWLATIQRADGAVPATSALTGSIWTTPFACLLWAALDAHESNRASATNRLLTTRGTALPLADRGPMGHDTTLRGWPWIADTHSWVEPTSLALLALAVEDRSDHARAVEGRALLRDRAIPGGGWNMGNPIVHGTPLRPFPGSTGLALLALRQKRGGSEDVVKSAIPYLKKALAGTLAPASLAWGLLGLRAWNVEPEWAGERLALAFERLDRRPTPEALAMLLLAAGESSLKLLGVVS